MKNVIVKGWQDVRNEKRVSLAHLMMDHARVGLPTAKEWLDTFVDEGRVVVPFETEEAAEAFAEAARAIGAVVTTSNAPVAGS